jgi:hypothetical protein
MLDFFVRGSRNNSKSHIKCQIEAANNRPDNPMCAAAAYSTQIPGFDEGSPLIVQPPQD